jgi:hypothetical protein
MREERVEEEGGGGEEDKKRKREEDEIVKLRAEMHVFFEYFNSRLDYIQSYTPAVIRRREKIRKSGGLLGYWPIRCNRNRSPTVSTTLTLTFSFTLYLTPFFFVS